eukprot:scaffold24_cov186-Alexandrium_tamarense.AAC.30
MWHTPCVVDDDLMIMARMAITTAAKQCRVEVRRGAELTSLRVDGWLGFVVWTRRWKVAEEGCKRWLCRLIVPKRFININ